MKYNVYMLRAKQAGWVLLNPGQAVSLHNAVAICKLNSFRCAVVPQGRDPRPVMKAVMAVGT